MSDDNITEVSEDIIDKKNLLRELQELREKYDRLKDRFHSTLYEKVRAADAERKNAFFINSLITVISRFEEGELIEANENALELFEFRKSEVIGRSVYDLNVYKDTRQRDLLKELLLREGYVEDYKLELFSKSGKVRYISISAKLVEINNEKYIFFAGYEITKRSRVETAVTDIVIGLSSNIGEKFFDSIVLQLTKILKSDFTFIGMIKIINDETYIETLSVILDNEKKENFKFKPDKTPCGNLLKGIHCSYKENAANIFSEDRKLKEIAVEGYVGVPIYSTRGDIVAVMAALFRDPVRDLKFVESILHVFAERTGAEIERSKSEEEKTRLIAILESTPDMIATFDPDLRLTYINRAGVILLGREDVDDIAGKSIKDIYPEHIFNKIIFEGIPEAIKDGSWRGESEIIHSKGFRIPVSQVILSHKSSNGEVEYLSTIIRDISDLKKTEDDLRRSKQRLQLHLEQTPLGVIEWNLKFEVTEWNRSAERIFGYSREEVLGKRADKIIIPDNQKKEFGSLWLDLLSRRHGVRTITDNITKEERNIICEWYHTSLVDESNAIIGIASVVHDITERKRSEEMMIEREKIMTIGSLAAGMAHEINNPLAIILQGAQNILRRLSPELPGNITAAEKYNLDFGSMCSYLEERKIIDFLNGIRESGIRASEIVTDLLTFSSRSEVKKNRVNINKLIENMVSLAKNDYILKKKYRIKDIEFKTFFDKSLEDIVCFKSEIEQVIINLIRNAAESIYEKKYINELPEIIIRTESETNFAKIEIEDNGIGMDEKTRKRSYEPFFTTKSAGMGRGLGLSVSYMIIKNKHKGTIKIESVPGEGTKFIIRLPKNEPNI